MGAMHGMYGMKSEMFDLSLNISKLDTNMVCTNLVDKIVACYSRGADLVDNA